MQSLSSLNMRVVSYRRHLLLLPLLPLLLALAAPAAEPQHDRTATSSAAITPLRLRQAPKTAEQLQHPLTYWQQRQRKPVRVVLSVLRIDLHDPQLEVATFIANDPDGDGPAEAKLVDPLQLATRHQALAAINANAFGAVPDAEGNQSPRYYAGMPVEIAGFAATDGVRRSGVYKHGQNNMAFWLDADGQAHIGSVPDADVPVQHGVNAWWGHLLADGKIMVRPGGDRHPRSAVGYDADGRWLYLVVADGRQQFYSNGMTLHELALFMQTLGVANAINLDGGGSSTLLVAAAAKRSFFRRKSKTEKELQVVNRPSSGSLRPVPVLLGVRARQP